MKNNGQHANGGMPKGQYVQAQGAADYQRVKGTLTGRTPVDRSLTEMVVEIRVFSSFLQAEDSERAHTFHSPKGMTTYRTRMVSYMGAVIPVVYDRQFFPAPKRVNIHARMRSGYNHD